MFANDARGHTACDGRGGFPARFAESVGVCRFAVLAVVVIVGFVMQFRRHGAETTVAKAAHWPPTSRDRIWYTLSSILVIAFLIYRVV